MDHYMLDFGLDLFIFAKRLQFNLSYLIYVIR